MRTAYEKKILLIEDDPNDARIVTEILKSSHRRLAVENAKTLKKGLEKLDHQHFDLVFLDLSLPDSAGVSSVDALIKKVPQLPIIVLTDVSKVQFAFLAIQKGAQDSLVKGETPASIFVRTMDNAILRKQSQLAMQHTIQALKETNKKILDQQKAVVEEERLKIMLQMAGATAHELNQPLMSLLGYLELIELENNNPKKYLDGIKKSGERISAIVKKIQSIRFDCVIPHTGGPGIINLNQPITLISIEDSDHDFGKLEEILKNQPQVNLLRVKSIKEAFKMIETNPVELVFLDHILPDGTSFDFMTILAKKKKPLPVVVITGQGDEMLASQIIQAGAYDYINKSNLNIASVTRIVKNALEKFHLKQEMQKAFEKLAQMATQDDLTNLNNRRLLNESLQREMSRLQRYGNDLSCLVIDLDHFKQINDTFGHHFGDHVLKEFAVALQKLVRSVDMIFRYGGEEFVILLPETNLYGGIQVAEKIRTHFEKKCYQHAEQSVVITVSIGVAAVIHHHIKEGLVLLSFAEKALYTAKAKGRNQVQVYEFLNESGTNSKPPVQYIKEQIQLLLEKTRKSAIASIERLIIDRSQMEYQVETQRVLYYIELLAKKLNFPMTILDTIKQAARLHDYLQVILTEGLLCKQAPLSCADKAKIENHHSAIAELVDLFDFFSDIRYIMLSHHEYFDGSGYPKGLRGDQIPIGTRLLTVVYAFVAMTSEKCYGMRLSDKQVIQELVSGAKTKFDPAMVALTLDMISQHKLLDVSPYELKKAIQTVGRILK